MRKQLILHLTNLKFIMEKSCDTLIYFFSKPSPLIISKLSVAKADNPGIVSLEDSYIDFLFPMMMVLSAKLI